MGWKRPLAASQPFKLFYTTYFILFALIKLFHLRIWYLTPALRPQPTWSYQLASKNELMKLFFEFWSVTRVAQQPRMKKDDHG